MVFFFLSIWRLPVLFWFPLIVSRENHRKVTRLGFSYPNHKSFGIRRQVFRSEINFWGKRPPCYELLPQMCLKSTTKRRRIMWYGIEMTISGGASNIFLLTGQTGWTSVREVSGSPRPQAVRSGHSSPDGWGDWDKWQWLCAPPHLTAIALDRY